MRGRRSSRADSAAVELYESVTEIADRVCSRVVLIALAYSSARAGYERIRADGTTRLPSAVHCWRFPA